MISGPGGRDGWRERSRGEAMRDASAGKGDEEKCDYEDYGGKSGFPAQKAGRLQKKTPT